VTGWGAAAANRAEVLDAALTRPGRFDRRIMVDPPDARGRRAILARDPEGGGRSGWWEFEGVGGGCLAPRCLSGPDPVKSGRPQGLAPDVHTRGRPIQPDVARAPGAADGLNHASPPDPPHRCHWTRAFLCLVPCALCLVPFSAPCLVSPLPSFVAADAGARARGGPGHGGMAVPGVHRRRARQPGRPLPSLPPSSPAATGFSEGCRRLRGGAPGRRWMPGRPFFGEWHGGALRESGSVGGGWRMRLLALLSRPRLPPPSVLPSFPPGHPHVSRASAGTW